MADQPPWAMKAAEKVAVAVDDCLVAQGLRHIPLPAPSELAPIIADEHDKAEKEKACGPS